MCYAEGCCVLPPSCTCVEHVSIVGHWWWFVTFTKNKTWRRLFWWWRRMEIIMTRFHYTMENKRRRTRWWSICTEQMHWDFDALSPRDHYLVREWGWSNEFPLLLLIMIWMICAILGTWDGIINFSRFTPEQRDKMEQDRNMCCDLVLGFLKGKKKLWLMIIITTFCCYLKWNVIQFHMTRLFKFGVL